MIALVYSYISVPETSGRALENMDELFKQPWYNMRQTARTVAVTKQDLEVGESKEEVAKIEHVGSKH